MLREEQLLAIAIAEHVGKADTARHTKFHIEEGHRTLEDAEATSEEWTVADETLKYHVEQLFLLTLILAEQLRLPLLRRELAAKRDSFDGQWSKLEPSIWDTTALCPALDCVKFYFNSMATMLDAKALTGLDIFETILQRTPTIVSRSAKPEPENETQVKEQVFEILKIAFRDATREVPFRKNFTTYKGDLAVPALKAVAEYKFADKQEDVGKLMDGFYADMKGYGGHYEWQNFYAVIYMTDSWYDQADFDKEFQLVRADRLWRPIAVTGKGQRIKRVKPAPTS